MKAVVVCNQNIAEESRRSQEEQVQIDIQDTIEDVKVKITTIYTCLDPQQFQLKFGSRFLKPTEKISELLKQMRDGRLTFVIQQSECFCSLI